MADLRTSIPEAATLLALLALLVMPPAAATQPSPAEASVRVGLALSGGGARGFAHIGALKVFDEAGIPVDLITGTSMGSVIGALYAVGYTGVQLEEIALEEDWGDLFSDQPGRRSFSMAEKQWESRYVATLPIEGRRVRLPSGLINGQKLMSRFAYYTSAVHHIQDFSRLAIPFACLAMDLETGELVRLESGDLVESVRASMSIPTVFTPVQIDGRVLVDGGVVRNLPAEDARALGAGVVIGIDVSQELQSTEVLTSLLDILGQTFDVNRQPFVRAQRDLSDVVVVPAVQEVGALDFSDVQGVIDQGAAATRAQLPAIRAVLDSLGVPHGAVVTAAPRASMAPRDRVYVTQVVVEGLEHASDRLVRDQLHLNPPGWHTAAELDAGIDRVFSTQFFERVTYRLEPDGDGVRVVLRAVEHAADVFRFGFQYDNRSRATIALNATFRNAAPRSATLVAEVLLGAEVQVQAQHFLYLGRRIGFRTHARYVTATPTVFDALNRGQRIQFSTYALEAALSNSLSQRVLYSGGLEAAYSVSIPKVAPDDVSRQREHLLMAFTRLWYDTLDRGAFPSRGHHLFARLAGSRQGLGSTASVVQLRLNWRAAYPVSPQLSILSELQLVTTDARDDLTINYGLGPVNLGGVHVPLRRVGTFVGLKQDERLGRHLKAVMLGIQYEPVPRRFVLLRFNVGNTFNVWTWDPRDEPYARGLGVSVGGLTLVGPLELTLATSDRRSLVADMRLGYIF